MLRPSDVHNDDGTGSPMRGRSGGSGFGRFGRHVAKLGVATGLALTAVAAIAPHAAAAATDAQSRGAQTVTVAAREAEPETLPRAGDGTMPVLLAGAGSLAIGGLALWFGGRRQAPRPTARR